MRSRIEVVASGPEVAVVCAGGLICDSANGGWDVEVLIPGSCDSAALRILGARVVEFALAAQAIETYSPPVQISTMPDIGGDTWLPRYLWAAGGDLAMRPIGGATRVRSRRHTHTFRHRLSTAARAFKAHALAAADLDTAVRDVEFFRPGPAPARVRADRRFGELL